MYSLKELVMVIQVQVQVYKDNIKPPSKHGRKYQAHLNTTYICLWDRSVEHFVQIEGLRAPLELNVD